jgi:hypothetical protein
MSFVVRGLLGAALLAWPTQAQAQTAPAAASPAPAPLRVYMRSAGPLTFSAHAESGHESPTWCISPCDARLPAGDYQLELNGVTTGDTLALRQPGTLRGEYVSHAGAREGAWLALNVGGIIGGVFITVGVASSSPTAFAVGGGVLVGATAIFFITYRADRAKVSFAPDPPPDVRNMPEPAPMSGTRHAALEPSSIGSTPHGLGFRIVF